MQHRSHGKMPHRLLVLFGDSILDNAPYTAPEQDTTAHLESILGDGWQVHRFARDGATMGGIYSQLEQIEDAPAAAVLSVGGNDVLAHAGLLQRRDVTAAEVLEELLQIADEFERRYDDVVRAVSERVARTVLCTIYEARLEPPVLARLARVPLGVLNDRIIRTGARRGLDVLDLRSVCTEPEDFVLQIEPSAQGAAKIARAIASVLDGRPSPVRGRVFAPHITRN